jgi:hypothetical protein
MLRFLSRVPVVLASPFLLPLPFHCSPSTCHAGWRPWPMPSWVCFIPICFFFFLAHAMEKSGVWLTYDTVEGQYPATNTDSDSGLNLLTKRCSCKHCGRGVAGRGREGCRGAEHGQTCTKDHTGAVAIRAALELAVELVEQRSEQASRNSPLQMPHAPHHHHHHGKTAIILSAEHSSSCPTSLLSSMVLKVAPHVCNTWLLSPWINLWPSRGRDCWDRQLDVIASFSMEFCTKKSLNVCTKH